MDKLKEAAIRGAERRVIEAAMALMSIDPLFVCQARYTIINSTCRRDVEFRRACAAMKRTKEQSSG